MHPALTHRGRLAAVLLLGVLVAACASGAAAPAAAPAAGQPNEPGIAPVGALADGEGATAGDPGGGNGAPAALRDDARIVYTGSLSLQVTDLDPAVAAGRSAAAALGGYIGASRITSDGEQSVASISYRIPAERWEEGLAAFRALGTVVGEETDAAEVTGQLVDLEARIKNLRASETSLQRIAEQATRIDDILDVERRLTEVRGQIEQLDAERANLEDRAAFGTLNVTYGRQIVAIVEAARGWNPGQEVDRASATLIDVLQALTTAGIWFAIVWLPLLLALAVLLLIGRFILRRAGILGRSAVRPSEG